VTPKTETSLTELLAADAAKVEAARKRTEPRPCHVCGADHMAEIVQMPNDDIRDLCDLATRQRRALERVLAEHESMGVYAPQWCAGCSAGKRVSEWVVWPCPVVVYIAAILEGKP